MLDETWLSVREFICILSIAFDDQMSAAATFFTLSNLQSRLIFQ